MQERRPLRLRGARWTSWALGAVLLVVPSPHVSAQSAWEGDLERFEVPRDCATREAFIARLDELGARPGTARIVVEVGESWSGLVRGVVTLQRAAGPPAERAIEDEICADVVDALAIATALALREPGGEPSSERQSAPSPPAPQPARGAPDSDLAPAATEREVAIDPPLLVRASLGAGVRLGLGPVPGLAPAPELSLALEIDRLLLALHLLGWPEAAAPEGAGVTPGVALYALGSTLEIGVRVGDDVAVVPAAVAEVSAVVARGLGVERARTAASVVLDLGAAATLLFDFEALRLFVRADILFALTEPRYVVADATAFAAPIVRGSGMVGFAYILGN